MTSYTSDKLLLPFEPVGKPDFQVLNNIKDVVSNDMEY